MKAEYLKYLNGFLAVVIFGTIAGSVAGVWIWERFDERDDLAGIPERFSEIHRWGSGGENHVMISWDVIRTGEIRDGEGKTEVLCIVRMEFENVNSARSASFDGLRLWFRGRDDIPVSRDFGMDWIDRNLLGGAVEPDGELLLPGDKVSAAFEVWLTPEILREVRGMGAGLSYQMHGP